MSNDFNFILLYLLQRNIICKHNPNSANVHKLSFMVQKSLCKIPNCSISCRDLRNNHYISNAFFILSPYSFPKCVLCVCAKKKRESLFCANVKVPSELFINYTINFPRLQPFQKLNFFLFCKLFLHIIRKASAVIGSQNLPNVKIRAASNLILRQPR